MLLCMKRVSFDMPDGIYKIIKLGCAYKGITMRQFLIDAIRSSIKQLEINNDFSLESDSGSARSNASSDS